MLENLLSDSAIDADPSLIRLAIESALNAIVVTDPQERILYANPAMVALCGYEAPEMVGKKLGELLPGTATDADVMKQMAEAIRNKQPIKVELLSYRKDSTPFWLEMQITPVVSSSRDVTHFLISGLDISERKHLMTRLDDKRHLLELANEILDSQTQELVRMNRTLELLSVTDVLTHLGNHRLFQDRLAGYIDIHQSNRAPLACAVLDIDNFRAFNDSFGHYEGDTVLKQLGKILNDFCRESGSGYRYGGEEFAILFPNLNATDIAPLMEQLRATIQAQDWRLRPITVSIGIAELSAGSSLLESAEQALSTAKEMGRNRVFQAENQKLKAA